MLDCDKLSVLNFYERFIKIERDNHYIEPLKLIYDEEDETFYFSLKIGIDYNDTVTINFCNLVDFYKELREYDKNFNMNLEEMFGGYLNG